MLLRLPVREVIFGIVKDLAGLVCVLIGWTDITWDDGSIIDEVEETATVASKDDLLLSALDRGSEFGGVGLLQLLSCLCEVSFPSSEFAFKPTMLVN